MYKVLVDSRAAKQLTAISSSHQEQITAKIEALHEDPRPAGCKKLKGETDLYRVRSGDYRIIYQIRDKELLILIVRIGHRSDVYR